MNNPFRTWRIIAALLICFGVLVTASLVFYPKQRVIGGLRGGPIGLNETAFRVDYACIGVEYDFCPNWPDYGCDYLCVGWLAKRTCSLETYTQQGLVQSPTACVDQTRPRWGFPPIQ